MREIYKLAYTTGLKSGGASDGSLSASSGEAVGMMPYRPLVTVTASPADLRGNVLLSLFIIRATNYGLRERSEATSGPTDPFAKVPIGPHELLCPFADIIITSFN